MNNPSYIPVEEIYKATNSGLKIILHYYPEAEKCINNKNHTFKIRDEKTPSASIKLMENNWIVKDFGDKALTPIQIVMENENLDFKNALDFAAKRFCNGNLSKQLEKETPKPIMTEANISDKLTIEFKENFSKFELETLGKYVTEENCNKYSLKPVKYYITDISEKTNKAWKIESTDEYPIYCFDFGTWKKIYKPLEYDKKYRFHYIGEHPKDYIFGLESLKSEVGKLKAIKRTNVIEYLKEIGKIETSSEEDINKHVDEAVKPLLSDLIICSGDRDALNVASAGYNVVWLNSETASLTKEQYHELKSLSNQIFNIPDIDKTGIKQGYNLAKQYIDIITIWLPDELKNKKDFRGNPCKDVTDFFRQYPEPIPLLNKRKNVSTPLRFWDIQYKKDVFSGYLINQTALYNFLKANGYCRYSDKSNKFGYVYLNIDDKIVKRIEPDGRNNIKNDVKDFINTYLERNLYDIALRNMFYKSRQTDEPLMANLPFNDNLDFKAFDKDYQYWFFPNVSWKITKEGIEEKKIKDIDKFVWKTDIKDKYDKVKLTEKPIFEVKYSKEYKEVLESKDKTKINDFSDLDKYDIQINDSDFIFMKFLENTSKMYWHKSELNEIQIKEQKLHLINKLYALGHKSHKYKDKSKTFAIINMDAKESEIGKSFGGSGKSIFAQSTDYINNTFFISGKDSKKTEDKFIFDNVDEHTFNIRIDDADQKFNYQFFFPLITDKFTVNPKNTKPFTLDYCDSPKIEITTNHALKNTDPSDLRRILHVLFSDYYHRKGSEGLYKEDRNPKEEFGKTIFTDFNQDEWNKFYNLMASCIQLYLSFDEKIEPPLENIEKRNLRFKMGESFLDWANDYFADIEHLNNKITKEDMFQHCKNSLNKNDASFMDARKFKDKIKYYCIYKGFVFNPSEMLDKSGRIMSDSKELFYIESKFDIQKLKNDKPEYDNEDNNNQEPVFESESSGEMPF